MENNIDPEDYLINGMVEEHIDYIKSPEYKKKIEMEVEEQIVQYIESRIKEYKDRAQESEALVLTWRTKIKEQLFMEISFHQPESITDEMIYKEVEKELEEFDKHFNITSQRYGE